MEKIITHYNDVFKNIGVIFKEHLFTLVMFVSAFLTPVVPFIIVTILFIGLDTIMGVYKTSKEERNSNRLKRGFIPKALLYTTLLLVGYTTDRIIVNPFVQPFLHKEYVGTIVLTCALILTEGRSIDENFKDKFGISIKDQFMTVLNLRKKLGKYLDNERKDGEAK